MRIINKSLEAFLKEKGILEQYLKNCNAYWKESNPSYIQYAFLWKDTPEGHGFWRGIRDEFDEVDPVPCIKRYNVVIAGLAELDVVEADDGEWVRFEDIEHRIME